MLASLGSVLPLAVGVAVSPIPIIAAILMLMSSRARVTGTGFLIGWVAGILVATCTFAALSGVVVGGAEAAPQPAVGMLQAALGVGLLFMAARQWRGRPQEGAEPILPPWMAAIDSFTFPKALGLGLVLAALNPKNLLLAAAAGLAIGTETGSLASAAVVIGLYTVIASCSVVVPVIGYFVASERMRAPLEKMRTWLVANNAAIVSVLLLTMGVVLLGKALGHF